MDDIATKRQKAFAKRKEEEANWQKANIERQRKLTLQQKVDADLDKASTEVERVKVERERIEVEYQKAEVDWKRAYAEWERVYAE